MPKKVLLDRTRAHQVYLTSHGRQVPGVTGILGCLDDGSGAALMAWAWKMGMEKKDYRKVRDQAADVGTVAHYLIECWLKKMKPDLSQYGKRDIKLACGCLAKFQEWWDDNNYKLIHSELQLVSDKFLFGGTLDILAKRKGKNCLLDLKTSKGIYPKFWTQTAAYGLLFCENKLNKAAIDETTIIRIGKEDASFETATRTDLSNETALFKSLISVYYNLQKTKSK